MNSYKSGTTSMKWYLMILPFFLLAWSNTSVIAQHYIYDAQFLTPEDGLANLMTNAVHQDNEGFVWISTPYGLNSYDGYSFKHYSKEENSLRSNNGIRGIKEDDAENLWLFYLNRISIDVEVAYAIDVFDKKTGKAIPMEEHINEELPFNITDVNHSTVLDPKKRLWLTTTQGELFLYEKGEFQKRYGQEPTVFKYVTIDKEDNIWLGYDTDVISINQSGALIEHIRLPDITKGVWQGEGSTMWFASAFHQGKTKGVDVWHEKKDAQHLERFSLYAEEGKSAGPLVNIHRDQNGFWYLNMRYQNLLFDRKGRQVFNFNKLLGVNGIGLLKYFEGENHMWWCTSRGILKTSVKETPFTLIHQNGQLSDCRGITEDESGNIHFINRDVYSWNPQKGFLFEEPLFFGGGHALTYIDGSLFFGTYNYNELGYKLDLRTNKTRPLKVLKGVNIYSIQPSDKERKLLAGTNAGLEYIDLDNDLVLPFEGYETGNPANEIIQKSTVYHLHRNASGIWVATNNGVFLIDENKGILGHFDDSNGLPFNYIMHIHEDEEGTFWLATKGGGIIKWQSVQNGESNTHTQQFTAKDGLSVDYLYAIYEDDYDRLWISSDKGIMCMDRNTHQVLKTYLMEDGLAHNEFNTSSHYQAKDGTLYFGGLGGLISFQPNAISINSATHTPLEFTGYHLLEEGKTEMTDKTILLKNREEIAIKPSDRMFELRFALLDFDDPECHRYAYQIEGYTDSWQTTEDNYLQITHLPYGSYILKIKGQNINKGRSENELRLKINVLAPFYLQWWFIGSLLVLALGGAVAFVRRRERMLEKDRERLEAEVQKRTLTIQQQTEELKAMDRARTRFFSNVTHEFRTPLTLIIGPLEQVIKDQPPPTIFRRRLEGVIKNARHLLTLINQMLDLSKLESGRMKTEVSRGDIVAHTRELVGRFETPALKKGQRLSFVASQSSWETHFDKDKWDKILYNLLSNSIKFSGVGEAIQLSLTKRLKKGEELIRLDIKDSGIGIEKEHLSHIFDRFYQTDSSLTRSQDGTGIGLALVKELVEMQGGEIWVSSEIGKGTSFEVYLPILEAEHALHLTDAPSAAPAPVLVSTQNLPTSIKQDIPLKGQDKLELLIIEDNEEMREYICYCIASQKYNISEASNGEEGIQKAQALIPDLIISDVMMPKKNGFEVAEAIRNNISTSHIPLILLTAKASLESRLKGLQRGADAYLTKPFSPQELSIRIQKLTEIRRLLQERYKKGLEQSADDAFQQEDEFVINLREYILQHLDESNLNGDLIGRHFGMSRVHLYRKLKALTDQSISEFVRSIRLKKALELVREGRLNVAEITYQTGFSSPAHFTRVFKKAYGKAPTKL